MRGILATAVITGLLYWCQIPTPAQPTSTQYGYDALKRGESLKSQGRLKAAFDCFDEGIRHDATNYKLWVSRGECSLRLNQYDAALKDLTQSIRLCRGKNWLPYALRGETYFKLDQYDLALKDLNEANALRPTISASRLIGDIHKKRKQYDAAERNYKKALAIAIKERNMSAVSIDAAAAANMRKMKGDIDGAIAILTGTLKLIPKDRPLLVNRAALYESQGKYKEAIDDLKKYWRFDSRGRDNIARCAQLHVKLKMYKEAIEEYSFLIKHESDRPSNYYERARVYDLAGQSELAKADRKKGLEMEKALMGSD